MARKQVWFNPYHNESNRRKKVNVSSRGKDKGGFCTTTPEMRMLAKRNRSYKHPNYHKLLELAKKAEKGTIRSVVKK